jgi:superfamily I DNA and/or RNA helicase
MTLARRRLVLVGDERQLPHLLDDELAEAVSSDDAEREEMQESLFGRMHRFLEQERRRGAPVRTVTLDAQFRMHPRLGDFVSQHFYEPHGQRLTSPAPAERFAHGLRGYEGIVASWHDVPTPSGRARRRGTSWARDEEAGATTRLVRTLMEEAPQLTFGVITFYTAQVESILHSMVGEGMCVTAAEGRPELRAEWQFTVDEAGRSAERLRVGTVDAFQGKEFDVVVLSAVRTPGVSGDGLGHLRIPNRLCVALSRQRRLLLVVGDQSGFAEHDAVALRVPALSELATNGSLYAAD